MTSKLRLLAAASVVSIAMLGANPAYAAGTTAGSGITNDVTVTYKVGDVQQTDKTASDTFTVDRKINLIVEEVGSTTTSVSPGQEKAVTKFTVSNLSNEVLDFQLSAAQLAGGTAAHGGTDSFDVANLQVFVDSNNNGVYDEADDTAIFIDELLEDETITVFVVGDIPVGQADDSVAGIVLTATAREGGTTGGSIGAPLVNSKGSANTAGVDTVFADGAGETDAAEDASFSAGDDYTVAAAALSVVKFSRIISDPINGTASATVFPKFIPGAVIEYCIGVANASGSATATSVTITDNLPVGITYNSGFGVNINGSYNNTNETCTAGADAGTFSSGVVSGTLNDISGGGNNSLVFRATVD